MYWPVHVKNIQILSLLTIYETLYYIILSGFNFSCNLQKLIIFLDLLLNVKLMDLFTYAVLSHSSAKFYSWFLFLDMRVFAFVNSPVNYFTYFHCWSNSDKNDNAGFVCNHTVYISRTISLLRKCVLFGIVSGELVIRSSCADCK